MELFPLALLIGDSYRNPGFFLALFCEKGGHRGPTGRKSARDLEKLTKSGEILGADRNSGDFSPGKSRSRGEKVPRGSSPARFLADSQEILGEILRGGGISRKKRKSRDFPGPPGPGPGAGPGARQKSQLPAGFPNFIHALRPAPLTLPQRARNGAKQPPPGKLTVELFPLALLIGESYQNPGVFLALFRAKGGTGGPRGGKVRGIQKK